MKHTRIRYQKTHCLIQSTPVKSTTFYVHNHYTTPLQQSIKCTAYFKTGVRLRLPILDIRRTYDHKAKDEQEFELRFGDLAQMPRMSDFKNL